MKILFLGTGAADWESDALNIEGIRRMSSAVINDRLLIDSAPSSYRYFKFLGGYEENIKNMILTHSHEDHLCFKDLAGFSKNHKIKLWCDKGVVEKLSNTELENIELCELKPFEKTEIEGISVLPLPANHIVEDSREAALHYIIEENGKKLFYGCDGGWFRCETWDYLRTQTLDCVVLDCTCGEAEEDYNWRLGSHNDIKMVRYLVKNMRSEKILKENSIAAVSHLAKTLHKGIAETEEILKRDNIIAAYDGMEISL